MTYRELQSALKILGLGDEVTLQEIKTRHRDLVKRYHPDRGVTSDEGKIRDINEAYGILRDYLSTYRFSFTEEAFLAQNPEERLRDQFSHDPIWGKG